MANDIPAAAARFEGRRGPLAGLLLRNLLFSILTLGIYRFWGRTHVRRFVWRHTVVLDDALEYLGTGGELFIGFLIAAAVLLPVFAVYSVLQFLFADGPQYALPALEALYYLVLFFLIQIAIYRMRRYRLTRTAWRGVRFGLAGSSLAYARLSFGYGLLTAATLGFAYPWMRVATLGYFARHAHFGAAELAMTPDAAWLFRRWAAVIALPVGALGFFAVMNFEILGEIGSFASSGDEGAVSHTISFVNFGPLSLLLVFFPMWIWYRVVEFRHMLGCLRIGDASLSSAVRSRFVFGRYLVFVLLLVAFGVLFGGFAVSTMFGLRNAGLADEGRSPF